LHALQGQFTRISCMPQGSAQLGKFDHDVELTGCPTANPKHLTDARESLDSPLLLVRGDDVDTDAAPLCSDPRLSSSIGLLVEDNAKPGTARIDTRPYFRCVLADSRCEYEAVEAIQRRGHGADLAYGTEYEQGLRPRARANCRGSSSVREKGRSRMRILPISIRRKLLH
jgi:hypothetical protein